MINLSILTGVGAGLLASGLSFLVIGSGEGIWFERVRLNSSTGILSKYKQLPCSGGLFDSITWVAHTNNAETRKQIETRKSIVLNNSKTKGCISIWWKKETYTNNLWRGIWNLVWALRDDRYGTILVSTVTADNRKIEVDGTFYVLQKETNNSWTTIGNWTKQKEKIENGFVEKVIHPGNSLSRYRSSWDFIKADEFDSLSKKVCSRNGLCNGSSSKSSIYKNWIYTTEVSEDMVKDLVSQKADAWGENINTWLNGATIFDTNFTHIYANTAGYYRLEDS